MFGTVRGMTNMLKSLHYCNTFRSYVARDDGSPWRDTALGCLRRRSSCFVRSPAALEKGLQKRQIIEIQWFMMFFLGISFLRLFFLFCNFPSGRLPGAAVRDFARSSESGQQVAYFADLLLFRQHVAQLFHEE